MKSDVASTSTLPLSSASIGSEAITDSGNESLMFCASSGGLPVERKLSCCWTTSIRGAPVRSKRMTADSVTPRSMPSSTEPGLVASST